MNDIYGINERTPPVRNSDTMGVVIAYVFLAVIGMAVFCVMATGAEPPRWILPPKTEPVVDNVPDPELAPEEIDQPPVHGTYKQAYSAMQANGLPIVVAASGKWCPSCPAAAEVRKRLWGKLSRMNYAEVDVDAEPELARKLGADRIPMLVIYWQEDGKWQSEVVRGSDAKRIEAAIDHALVGAQVPCRCGCGKKGCTCNNVCKEDAA